MDLFKTWEQVTDEKLSQPHLSKEQITEAIRQNSHSTIAELKKRLKYKIYWILSGTIIIPLWMLLSARQSELLLILGAFLLQNLLFLIPIGTLYTQMSSGLSASDDALHHMKKTAALINKALRIDAIVGLITIPWSVVGGILLSNYYRGYSISTALHNPTLIIVAVIILIIALPLGYYVASKANAFAYGKYMLQLRENILQMEKI
jgi:hypothetical protein